MVDISSNVEGITQAETGGKDARGCFLFPAQGPSATRAPVDKSGRLRVALLFLKHGGGHR
jgi:hypothetical protein